MSDELRGPLAEFATGCRQAQARYREAEGRRRHAERKNPPPKVVTENPRAVFVSARPEQPELCNGCRRTLERGALGVGYLVYHHARLAPAEDRSNWLCEACVTRVANLLAPPVGMVQFRAKGER